MLRQLLSTLALLPLLAATPAHADELAFPDLPKSPMTIGDSQLLVTACKLAGLYVVPDAVPGQPEKLPVISDTQLQACFGDGSSKAWSDARASARVYIDRARLYYLLHGAAAPKGVCEGGAAEPKSIATAKSAVVDEQAKAQALKADLALKQAASDAADIRVATQQSTVDAAVKAPAATQQPLTDRLSELKIEQKLAHDALAAAQTAVKDADQRVAIATATAGDAWARAATKAQADTTSARIAMEKALSAAMDATKRDPTDFAALLDDPDRLKACTDVRDARLSALGGDVKKEQEARDNKQQLNERTTAHRADLFRKAESAVSGAFSGNGFAEQPGSPDKTIFTLMSALGADSRTNGTQLIMTLNLASIIEPSETERVKLDSTLRNLTLRANLPLDATDTTPQSGPATPTDPSAVTAASKSTASRFSLVLGSSFLDDTDQRLSVHDTCYRAVLAYRPPPETAERAADAADERKDYYDVCNRRAAQAQRLAWRAGAAFITPRDAGTGKTRPELIAGALVWGPTQWLYVDAFYQHILEPTKVRSYGVALSFGGNVGGKSSGVDSWARIGLDVIGVYAHTLQPGPGVPKDDVEFRITPTIRAKFLGGTVMKLGAGPRILSSDPEHPAVLASLALTYDADALIDQLLVTPTATN